MRIDDLGSCFISSQYKKIHQHPYNNLDIRSYTFSGEYVSSQQLCIHMQKLGYDFYIEKKDEKYRIVFGKSVIFGGNTKMGNLLFSLGCEF